MLQKLCSVPDFHRDGQWEKDFLQAFSVAKVHLPQEEVSAGPDGWPYFFVEIQGEKSEPVANIVHWLSERGVGLVVNANKELPDYVFPYGMLWGYREFGQFLVDKPKENQSRVELKQGDSIMVGPPSPQYFPPYVAKVLQEFLAQQDVSDAKVIMASEDGESYDLCFSCESLGDPPEEEHQGILEALAWFFPPHYSLVLISEKGLPDFYSLESVADGSIEN